MTTAMFGVSHAEKLCDGMSAMEVISIHVRLELPKQNTTMYGHNAESATG